MKFENDRVKSDEDIARLNAISALTTAILNNSVAEEGRVFTLPEILNELPYVVKKVSQSLFGDNKPIFSSPIDVKDMRGKDGTVLSSVPKVPIEQSVHDDYIVCLLDGLKFKSMKRHLTTAYGITPEEYRQLFSLPDTYPLVCENYKSTRSHLAKTQKRV